MKLSKLTKPELERISNNANFTEEEQKIFWLISQGKNLQEIACRLSLSKSTVSRRLRDIQDKIERSEQDMAVPPNEAVDFASIRSSIDSKLDSKFNAGDFVFR